MLSGTDARSNRPALRYELPSILDRIDLRHVFVQHQPVELELGSGDGSFLFEQARSHPERNFLGLERLLGRLQKMGRKAARSGLINLVGIRIESGYFLRYLLPPGSVAAVHVYFPDPWPKRKHRNNRLINEAFPTLAHCALAPGGKVYLRTDDVDYFQQMLEVFAASSRFRATETPGELAGVLTDFEKEFNARRIKTLSAAYQSI